MSNSTLTVGFVGLGDQGLPMAAAIAGAGCPLQVWARHRGSLEQLADTPHTQHDTLAGLATSSDVVCLCVNTDEDVHALVTGGLADNMRRGTVIVNHGTGTPAQAIRIAAACRARGVDYLDAPVSGGRAGAEARTLVTMVGGPTEAFTRCKPAFLTFSSSVIHLGGHGAGELAKLLNNTLMMMNQANIADVLELADHFQLDTRALIDVLQAGSGTSAALGMMAAGATTTPPEMIAHLHEVLLLDMNLFEAAMRESDAPATTLIERGYAGAHRVPQIVETLSR